ncbi:MAG: BsuPI-related putative proteinase inhibitor [bacterium]|nr:BsuPI-related putative proteinase inhibitor [bacterium]
MTTISKNLFSFAKISHGFVLFSLFSILLFSVFVVGTAEAQNATGIIVEITTDKSQYTVGEDIFITVKAVNTSNVSQTLSFSSSLQADYAIGGKYRWSSNKAFLQFLTSVVIPAGSSRQWEFTHKPSDFKLDSGTHTISGEVVGHGSAQTTITVVSETQPPYFESFESGLGGWQTDHEIHCEQEIHPCLFEWSIERSTEQAQHGNYSLESFLNGINDDGTIWMEKTFPVPQNSTVTIDLSFQLWSEAATPVTQWPVVAYIGTADPELESDFTIVGYTNTVAGWQAYSHSRNINTGSSSRIWVAFGFGATWEVSRTYFMDSVTVTVPPAPPVIGEKFVIGMYPVEKRSDRMFIVSVTDQATIQQARNCYAYGQQNPGDPRCGRHISGQIASGNGGFNTNWSWHLIPETVIMPTASIEICDGSPNDVERDGVDFDAGVFCPWISYILAPGGQYPQISPSTAFTRNLTLGLRGNDVKELQRVLASDPLIYPEGFITGYFGPLTRKAVIKFQEKYASEILTPIKITKGTGFVGPMTMRKLREIRQTTSAN